MPFLKEHNHFHMDTIVFLGTNDETLPNFLKRKHQERERKRNKGFPVKSMQANSLKHGGPQGGKGTIKNRILLLLQEAL
jgi:hypothetical protein